MRLSAVLHCEELRLSGLLCLLLTQQGAGSTAAKGAVQQSDKVRVW